MNRYTLRVQILESAQPWSAVKKAAEHEFLYARRPITFRWGRVEQADGDRVLAEIATDVSRTALLELVRPLEARFPVRFDSIGWGWPITDSTRPDGSDALAIDRTGDHYALAMPQEEPVGIYAYSVRQTLRLIELVAIVLFVGSLAVVPLLSTAVDRWLVGHDYLFLFVLAGYWFSSGFLRIQILPMIYVHHIRCDEQGIEINHLLRSPQRFTWPEIIELDMTFDQGTVWTSTERCKFTIGEELGLNDGPRLVKTILVRAGLHFVGYIGSKGAVYKCYDAE